ncbi:S8 family serine peptidase [candidate division KSB1 bacterium]|nr:S8 family serine peptidase [candidate division KSB1 bacterium]
MNSISIKKNTRIAAIFILLLAGIIYAADAPQRHKKTRTSVLQELAARWRQEYNENRSMVEAWAQQQNIDRKQVLPSGKIFELVRFRHDRPLFYATANLHAASTVTADCAWPGGSNHFDLTGKNMILAAWDGDGVLTTHQEFGGRITKMDSIKTTGLHATHVAGTLIAAGIIPSAKGMAYDAELQAYDWNNDIGEMALAAAGGLLLSNHSYGHATGWVYNIFGDNRWVWLGDPTISDDEDYFFGLYTETSRKLDEMAYHAPYYLMVRSAGNERADAGPAPGTQYWILVGRYRIISTTERSPDGPYDSLSDDAISKNILTVGAIDDILDHNYNPLNIASKMTDYSSWGPADDGRIKPDLVTNGQDVYSTSSTADDAYATLNGTSMAAPCATGSLALLQEYYGNTHEGDYMLASTVKALVIHTAHESGPDQGPDYRAGWGLLNTEGALGVIQQNGSNPMTIQEMELQSNAPCSLLIYAAGQEPLKVTICWTDPPGTPFYALDPDIPVLVNDLDLRLTRLEDGKITMPWRLDRDNPAAAATRGDNQVDNVEQVLIPEAIAGSYLITIDHKNNLYADRQVFAMVITGASPAPTTCSLDINIIGQGLVEKNLEKPFYLQGELLQVSASPDSDWKFIKWSGDIQGSNNPENLLMDGDKSITATFMKKRSPLIDSKLLFVNNTTDSSSSEIANLHLNLLAINRDSIEHAVKLFQGGFLLNHDFAMRVLNVTLSNQFFPQSSYSLRQEQFNDDPSSPDFGRVSFRYGYTGGVFTSLSPDTVSIVDVIIRYQKTSTRSVLAPNQLTSNLKVLDQYDIDLTGDEETPSLELFDMALPIELAAFTAHATGHTVYLEWTTISEKVNLGFDVYRRESHDERYVKINDHMIPGAGTSLEENHYRYLDDTVVSGKTYYYQLADISYSGQITFHDPVSISIAAPEQVVLQQNYPNPFNAQTTLSFSLPQSGHASLNIYDLQGRHIRTIYNQTLQAGCHEIVWDGRDESGQSVPSGIYFYRLRNGTIHKVRRMHLIQ